MVPKYTGILEGKIPQPSYCLRIEATVSLFHTVWVITNSGRNLFSSETLLIGEEQQYITTWWFTTSVSHVNGPVSTYVLFEKGAGDYLQ